MVTQEVANAIHATDSINAAHLDGCSVDGLASLYYNLARLQGAIILKMIGRRHEREPKATNTAKVFDGFKRDCPQCGAPMLFTTCINGQHRAEYDCGGDAVRANKTVIRSHCPRANA